MQRAHCGDGRSGASLSGNGPGAASAKRLAPRVLELLTPRYRTVCSDPHRNAHVRAIEITYPFHPQCGTTVAVLRMHRRGGQECFDVLDVHGSPMGLPAWMTERRWRALQLASKPIVPLAVLRSVRGLLTSLKSASNESRNPSFEGGENGQIADSDSAGADFSAALTGARAATGVGPATGGTLGTSGETK
jgi:hypothetical protein